MSQDWKILSVVTWCIAHWRHAAARSQWHLKVHFSTHSLRLASLLRRLFFSLQSNILKKNCNCHVRFMTHQMRSKYWQFYPALWFNPFFPTTCLRDSFGKNFSLAKTCYSTAVVDHLLIQKWEVPFQTTWSPSPLSDWSNLNSGPSMNGDVTHRLSDALQDPSLLAGNGGIVDEFGFNIDESHIGISDVTLMYNALQHATCKLCQTKSKVVIFVPPVAPSSPKKWSAENMFAMPTYQI